MFKVPKKSLLRKSLLVYLAVVFLTLTFVGGYSFGQIVGVNSVLDREAGQVTNKEIIPEHLSKDIDFSLFWEVWDLVKRKHLKQPVNEAKLAYGAMAGIVAALEDPYSVFFEPEISKKFLDDMAGTFSGIGAEIEIKNSQLIIVAPLSDSPAERAGIRAGDSIMAIDGESTAGITIKEAVDTIRGPEGTVVMLLIMRDGLDGVKEIPITRGEIIVKSVELEIKEGNIAYVSVRQFGNDTIYSFKKIANEIIKKDVKGIILDLRGNPGGYLDAAVEMTGEWVNGDVVVFEEDYTGSFTEYRSVARGQLKGIPTVVLVNQGSASGSEIVAGALQDYEMATVVGMQTFGKGSVQDYEQLRDGSAVKITIAEWLTPNKRSIEDEGVAPDIEVDLTEEDFNADLDPQMEKAMEILSQ
ncbi:MAG: S41 family peptidase [Patescibacteria group bacterium]|nr:S41 family peptidase [Patescibacteria group bacterium]